jgi:hypothetical protein
MLQLSPHKRGLKAVDAWPNITSKPVARVIRQRKSRDECTAGLLPRWAEANLTKMIAVTAP